MESSRKKNVWAIVATNIGTAVTIIGGLIFFGEHSFNAAVDARIDIHEENEIEKNSKQVKLRTLLSNKMGVDEDEVHIELGKMYKNKKIHINRMNQRMNGLVDEVKIYHPFSELTIE